MAFVPDKIAPGIDVEGVLDYYTIRARLGGGNFSTVWLAEHQVREQDRQASQLVALKILMRLHPPPRSNQTSSCDLRGRRLKR
jgi:hypothetical protein